MRNRTPDWIDKEFLPENRRRLKSAHSFLKGELQSLGIPYLERPAALFVWADLRKVKSCPQVTSNKDEKKIYIYINRFF